MVRSAVRRRVIDSSDAPMFVDSKADFFHNRSCYELFGTVEIEPYLSHTPTHTYNISLNKPCLTPTPAFISQPGMDVGEHENYTPLSLSMSIF